MVTSGQGHGTIRDMASLCVNKHLGKCLSAGERFGRNPHHYARAPSADGRYQVGVIHVSVQGHRTFRPGTFCRGGSCFSHVFSQKKLKTTNLHCDAALRGAHNYRYTQFSDENQMLMHLPQGVRITDNYTQFVICLCHLGVCMNGSGARGVLPAGSTLRRTTLRSSTDVRASAPLRRDIGERRLRAGRTFSRWE